MRSSGIRWLGLSTAIVTLAFLAVAAISKPGNTAGPCIVTSRAELPEAPEASGLAFSLRHDGILWTHNDSGHEAILFALDLTGTLRGQVHVPARLRDWEDVSAAPCEQLRGSSHYSGGCLYIGDIGDNSLARPNVQVLVVPEPDPEDRRTPVPDTYALTYPDGPHNAEAMFVVGGRVFIVTRDKYGELYGSPTPLGDSRTIRLERISRLALTAVTDAEASPGGQHVAVRTSDEVVLYGASALIAGRVNPLMRIPIAGLREPQGEAVALSGGHLFLASEGRPWKKAGRFIALRCDPLL